jgi:hypothetical protein
MSQFQHPGRGLPRLGQRVAQLGHGELMPGRRHLRRALQLAPVLRAAADQLSHRELMD